MKILIIRFSSMGDVVLTTPVLRCLKKQMPKVQLHYVTKRQNAPLLEANPYIDQMYSFSSSLGEVLPQLQAEQYDYVIDLHNNLRSWYLKLRLFAVSFSYDKANIPKFLMTKFKWNILPQEHIVDRYLNTVKFLKIKNDFQGLDYFIPEGMGVDFSLIPRTHQSNYIAFSIGGTHATKRLPLHKIMTLCKLISHPIFLLGGPAEKEVAQKVVDQLGDRIYNGCGAFTMHESASVVEKALWVISHDTALMHIASAFGKNILSVWGNTIPEFGMYPYGAGEKSRRFQVENLSCRPCSKIGYEACPKKHFKCMEEIDIDAIYAHINQ